MVSRNTGFVLPLRQYGNVLTGASLPSLTSLRRETWHDFLSSGLDECLRDAPDLAADYRYGIRLYDPLVGSPEHSPIGSVRDGLTFEAPLTVMAQLTDRRTSEVTEQRIILCRLPIMTDDGGFVISGVRRTVIHQIVRAPGVWFDSDYDPISGLLRGKARIIPERGPWIGFDTSKKDELRVSLNGGRRLSALAILYLYGLDAEKVLNECSAGGRRPFMLNTILRDDCQNQDQALLQVYAEVARGAPPNIGPARDRIDRMLFNARHYSLGPVGRHMLSRRFGREDTSLLLTSQDLVDIVRQIIQISLGEADIDDIDHLANRRVRSAAELTRREFEAGLHGIIRAAEQRLEMGSPTASRPSDLLSTLPLIKRLSNFFSASKLCQVTDETNPIAELTHKRRVTSLGPGGLQRESAGVEPRDVHHTHYGRLCPIETPEGQNIGLLTTLTTSAQIDRHGLLTTPVLPVIRSMSSHDDAIVGHQLTHEVVIGGSRLAEPGDVVDKVLSESLKALSEHEISVKPYVSDTTVLLNAHEESTVTIGQAAPTRDQWGQVLDDQVTARHGHEWRSVHPDELHYVDLLPRQIVSASTSLIPFLEHNDANRALMGCNMQRQAVPLVNPQPALVTTGMEVDVARDSNLQERSETDGVVTSVSSDEIAVTAVDGSISRHMLQKATRSNAFTWISQRPLVRPYQCVVAGQILADGPACRDGELALGQRVLVAYMSWEGTNYEDGILLSERVLKTHKFQSHILKRFSLDFLETPFGPELLTQSVPDVADWRRRRLDEDGIAPVGAFVSPGQILIGKASPRPAASSAEKRTPEEDFLFAVLGETSDSIRWQDKSRLLPKGQQGRVVSRRVISRADGDAAARRLPPGCHMRVEVEVAGTRRVQPGDKMSGRHGNKGCVTKILPEADMPFLPDGTPVDVCLSPLGVPSRMNLGQLMEVHLGWAAHRLGFRARTPVFDSASWEQIEQCLAQAWLVEYAGGLPTPELPSDDICQPDWARVRAWCDEEGRDFEQVFGPDAESGTVAGDLCLRIWMKEQGLDDTPFKKYENLRQEALRLDREVGLSAPIMGKQLLRDGRTGEFLGSIMVGYKYMMKLGHMVEDKMHARSTGTYSAITQQPLGGKGAGGGQRLGEMEVWALEAYSAAHLLREMVTYKSDDIEGRHEMLQSIMADGGTGLAESNEFRPGTPASFNVLTAELRSLGLDMQFLDEGDDISLFLTNREEPEVRHEVGS